MGLLLLFTSTLLSSYFHPWIVVNAEPYFVLRAITLTIEPGANVTRDTSVTLRCHASISSSGQEPLSREYTLYKGSERIYNKVMSTSEDFLHQLPNARLSDTGKYKCEIRIKDKSKTSENVELTVTGLSKPVLHVNNSMVSEGEEVIATCMAPGERGSFYFYFYEDSKEIHNMQASSNQAEARLSINSVGSHIIHCEYAVLVIPFVFKSEQSDTLKVSVTELSIAVSLDISPQHNIYEGDQIDITCSVINFPQRSYKSNLYLSQGDKILKVEEKTTFTHSMIIKAKDSVLFECGLEMGNVKKVTTKKVSVTELFSVPTLTMSPAEVFQRDAITLTCRSENYAPQRLKDEELTYSLEPTLNLQEHGKGVYSVKATFRDINITCIAKARDLMKQSEILAVRPKVRASRPRISVIGRAIIQQPITILCQSDSGSLPINYTLFKGYDALNTISVKDSFQQALFTVTINRADEIKQYTCEADNTKGRMQSESSDRLRAFVTEPLKNPALIVIPEVEQIFEGGHLSLICTVTGTPPVTFKFYQQGNKDPLHTTTSNENHTSYEVPRLSKAHSGKYFCEADNHAHQVVSTELVNIEVRMAIWKKALIGGSCLLALSVLVVVCVLCFKSKRGKREAPAELSVKPSSPKSDDSLTVNLTHDTEVYNADTVKVDKATVSVWSKRPPEDDVVDDEESSVVNSEPDVEYTEVVHPQPVDPNRGAADHHDYQGSVEYAELNGEHPEINHYRPEVNSFHDLPEPVD
ncbi:platelet endothelial cell adhesion molecule isoform X3 [Larimichthys crocea]|uniref:platelet endothelial cell adhesion molecule isoform X3 n=1 Tax=Larimichthys crocea TaxID=215358 RepID=UPI000F5F71DC|nr:platelet endothelial cell adhesion molecule-like isoform X3 [Larimichthys crocea]